MIEVPYTLADHGWFHCHWCGCLVADRDQHNHWHQLLADLARQVNSTS